MAAILNSGDISATAFGSAGIYAAGTGETVVMNTGTVVGGCPLRRRDAAFGQRQQFVIELAERSPRARQHFAIDNVGDSNTVENFGTVTGDVLLTDTGGGSEFINHAGALFNSGADVDVDAGFVINDGTIAPGGRGIIRTTDR